MDADWSRKRGRDGADLLRWPHTLISWEDFADAPPDKVHLFQELSNAFEKARLGDWVEVSCEAGCGRTGTVLACMAVISGVDPAQAVSWIRRNYDSCAVETAEQEKLISEFSMGFSNEKTARKLQKVRIARRLL